MTTTAAGASALAAAMSWAGTVLSQPPIRTTRVHGLGADHLFGVHRHQVPQEHAVGWEKDSWIEIVGKAIGIPPASMTPRFTASISFAMPP